MANYIDLIVDNIGQLCTIPSHDGNPQRGHVLGELGAVRNGAVAVHDGQIVEAGPRDAILEAFEANQTIDAGGRLVTPGLVDAHTHLIWAGDRAEEFEQRLAGASYQEIMAAGGGITRTVRKTRGAQLTELVEEAKLRLDRMLRHGTTTAEVKTGYGLNPEAEMNMLNAIGLLDAEHVVDLVPTFLGAHAVPPEYASHPEHYVELLIDHIIPLAATWKSEHWPGPLFCDAFCEEGAFDLDQTRRILERGKLAGMPLRLHADEFAALGGTALAVEMGARTVDHLLVTTQDDVELLGGSDTIAVLLPATPFGLGIQNTAPAQALIEANAIVVLATDCNPGTAWCESLQMVMALGTRTLGMSPAQVLAATTINAAFAVDRGDRIGSLEPGKLADMVIWDAPDYRHLSYRFGANMVHSVIKNGQVVIEF